jgi:polysaccharide pyruvyl transferase WcaK-like protein/glycosyltransferase involved in cell wall biosynthesis
MRTETQDTSKVDAALPEDGAAAEPFPALAGLRHGSSIVLLGYLGFRNLGDDLMLRSCLEYLEQHRPDLRVTLFARDRRFVAMRPGMRCVDGVGLLAKLRKVVALLRAQAFFWIGGTCLYERAGHPGLRQLQLKVSLARWLHKPFHFVDIAIGSFETDRGRQQLVRILRNCASASFRTRDSLERARAIEPCSAKLVAGGDLASLLEIPPRSPRPLRFDHIGFSGTREHATDIAAVLRLTHLLQRLVESGATIHFFAFHEGIGEESDHALHRRLAATLPLGAALFETYNSVEQLAGRMSAMDFHIGMRLHSVILCDLLGVPGIGLASSQKTSGYLRKVGASERCIPFDKAIDAESIRHLQSTYRRPAEALTREKTDALRGLSAVFREPVPEPHAAQSHASEIVFLRSTSARFEPVLRKRAAAACLAGMHPTVLYWVRKGHDFPFTEQGIRFEPIVLRAEYGRGIDGLADRARFFLAAFSKLCALRPQTIHACDFDMMILASCYKILRAGRVHLVYDILDFIYDFSSSFPPAFRTACRWFDGILCRMADAIVLPDENRLSLLPQSARCKVTFVHNAPDLAARPASPPAHASGMPLTILYAGGFSVDRGLPMLMNAVAERPTRFRLVMAGQGIDAAEAAQMAVDHGNIQYLGQIPFSKVEELTAECDLLYAVYDPASPVNRVASPNKFFEAVAFGKPIVVALGTSIDETVRRLDCGWVTPYAPEAVAATLDCIDRDSASWKGRNAAAAQSVYGWPASRQALHALYRSLA